MKEFNKIYLSVGMMLFVLLVVGFLFYGFGKIVFVQKIDGSLSKAEGVGAEMSEPGSVLSAPGVRPLQDEKVIQELVVPSFESLPKGEFGESAQRGKEYLEQTYKKLPQHVGSKLNCVNCHLQSGTVAHAGPWVGVVARFPQYRARSAKMDTLPDRINDCFERSLNGKRLPENSLEMTDIVSYMAWLSRGYAVGQDVEGSGMPKLKMEREPNLENGKNVYLSKCSSCHQADGQGLYAESEGVTVFPALWGPKSFNVGAGMARLHTAAGFVKKNMPLGQENTLSDDEAWDVAAYFSQQPRPDFKKKNGDWQKGGRPSDARY